MSTGRSGVEMEKRVEIDGEHYLIQHPSPTKGWATAIKLTKIVGEPFASMAGVDDKKDNVGDVLPKAMKALMSNIQEGDSMGLIKEILSTVSTIEDKQNLVGTHFDHQFRGRLGHMIKVVTAAVEFQFEDFFVAVGDAISDLIQKAMTEAAKAA